MDNPPRSVEDTPTAKNWGGIVLRNPCARWSPSHRTSPTPFRKGRRGQLNEKVQIAEQSAAVAGDEGERGQRVQPIDLRRHTTVAPRGLWNSYFRRPLTCISGRLPPCT
ncbi:hypothetical protein NOCA2120137 [metagenome]|uniref:Uncharacterized protein n=1 Tax=metagenome TaxID=256318 RepID=A0A2P2BWH8_9ZZZZ